MRSLQRIGVTFAMTHALNGTGLGGGRDHRIGVTSLFSYNLTALYS